MKTRSEWQGRVETGVVEHEGRDYRMGGSYVDGTVAIGYPHFPRDTSGLRGRSGELRSWDGKKLGTCKVVSSWRIRSYLGSHMNQIEVVIDGVRYTGRGFGHGMIWRGKRKAR